MFTNAPMIMFGNVHGEILGGRIKCPFKKEIN